jgi:sensor domain CHASE-containing protein
MIQRGIMDIRRKTLLVLGITFVVLFCIIAGVSVFLYVDQLGHLEQQDANKEVTEVISAISNEQDDLSNTLHDWSYWDDTYKFVLDQNPDYITQNLDEKSLSGKAQHIGYPKKLKTWVPSNAQKWFNT